MLFGRPRGFFSSCTTGAFVLGLPRGFFSSTTTTNFGGASDFALDLDLAVGFTSGFATGFASGCVVCVLVGSIGALDLDLLV